MIKEKINKKVIEKIIQNFNNDLQKLIEQLDELYLHEESKYLTDKLLNMCDEWIYSLFNDIFDGFSDIPSALHTSHVLIQGLLDDIPIRGKKIDNKYKFTTDDDFNFDILNQEKLLKIIDDFEKSEVKYINNVYKKFGLKEVGKMNLSCYKNLSKNNFNLLNDKIVKLIISEK